VSLALLLAAALAFPDAPPVAARISVSAPNAQDQATVAGAAGAVLPQSWVILVNLSTGHYVTARAAADGSFAATLVAPRGTTLEIKADPEGKLGPAFGSPPDVFPLGSLPGTFIRVPDAPAGGEGIRFNGAERRNAAYVLVDGTINKRAFSAGETLTVDAKLTVVAPAASAQINGAMTLGLVRLSTAEGREIAMENFFGSTTLTPTGLPIERGGNCGWALSSQAAQLNFGPFAAGRAETTARATVTLPPTLQTGYYQPFVTFFFQNPPPAAPGEKVLNGYSLLGVTAPLIRIGEPSPPRLVSMLFAETWSQGTRGVQAIEDRATYAFAPHIATQSDVLVIPRNRYRLEPYLPVMGISDRGSPMFEPRFPLKFPSGSLTARLTRPDGSTTVIGPAPLAQGRSMMPVNDDGFSFDGTGRHPGDVYQLSTMDPRFEADLLQYGRYRVVLDGSVDDLWGTAWKIAGTYEFIVAEPLILDTATLPGTPFEVGDKVSFALTTIPPVPGQVDATFRLAPGSDPSRIRETAARGTANRFGFFRPFDESAVIGEAGEYRFDAAATYVDAQGVWWAGSRTWGGVVAPRNSTLTAHGRRGFLTQDPPRQPWYFKSQLGALAPDSHVTFPFHGGDVAWLKDSAMLVAVTLQDNGPVEALIRARCGANDLLPGETLPGSSRPDRVDAHLDPSRVDLWSYAYASVQRPLFRVREVIADNRVGHAFGYWQFREHYGAQRGVENGDFPNDIKFMFGGVVARGSALPKPQYAIYGSLFVFLGPDDTLGTRVFPPFQGNGGGPSGGPIMTLLGKPVEIFFHPTSVRPGTILERGSRASFAGYAAPTLPSKVEIAVTSPSGNRRIIAGETNLVGYFNDPASAFDVDESGVWTAKVKIWFDGAHSGGQVTPPYPTGGVLGSREGEFNFYAVDAREAPLAVSANLPTFTAIPPAGLTNVEVSYTTTMPGFVLEEGRTAALTYTFDPQRLSVSFPNLDPDDEIVTISLLLSGTDAAGKWKHHARQITLQGQQLQMPAQTATPASPRRRAAR